MKLSVNGKSHTLDVEPEMPLLWALRDELDIKGPKFGCGVAQCGSCTVLLNGEPVRSCSYPVSVAAGQKVIGFVGNTGKSVGPHLHYEVHKDGQAVNPVNFYYNDLSAEDYSRMIELSGTENQAFD